LPASFQLQLEAIPTLPLTRTLDWKLATLTGARQKEALVSYRVEGWTATVPQKAKLVEEQVQPWWRENARAFFGPLAGIEADGLFRLIPQASTAEAFLKLELKPQE
jgi:hypothetical protein